MADSIVYGREELKTLALRCVMCTAEVPDSRSRRRKDTCSVECYEKLRQWRKYLLSTRKCISCLAPYTEKQREEFRRWRQAEGSLRVTKGRPPLAIEAKLREALLLTTVALDNAIEWAKQCDMPGADSDEIKHYEMLVAMAKKALIVRPPIPREPKPVDTAPPERDSISTSHIEA